MRRHVIMCAAAALPAACLVPTDDDPHDEDALGQAELEVQSSSACALAAETAAEQTKALLGLQGDLDKICDGSDPDACAAFATELRSATTTAATANAVAVDACDGRSTGEAV